MDTKQALAVVGSLGQTTKMPGRSWGISAKQCNVGGKLAEVAGSVCNGCYAMRSFYRYPTVTKAHAKRLALITKSIESDNGDTWVAAMSHLLMDDRYFRFLDSGDLQSVEMLDCFVRVARAVPDCKFWIPTREYEIVSAWFKMNPDGLPSNVTLRLSGLMVNGPAPTSLAKRLGVQVSRVVSDGSHTCHAIKNNNECGACRKCWTSEEECVSYKKH